MNPNIFGLRMLSGISTITGGRAMPAFREHTQQHVFAALGRVWIASK
jgi:hypothetical protein